MRRSTQQGFTLVEIMIVVAIIALLAAIAIPNVLRGRTTANESAAIGNLRALLSSVEMYRSVYQAYPGPDGAAFRAAMYTVPTPDFGPPSFDKVLDGGAGSVVQGYNYSYTSTGSDVYSLVAEPEGSSTGSRLFLVTEEGLIHHCSGDKTKSIDANDNTIDQSPAAC